MQEAVVKNVLAGRDSLILMPTGSGKSICYQLPSLLLNGMTLVVSPLIALMKDQVDALKSKGVRAAFINSSMSYSEIRNVQMDAYRGNLAILYVAPERLVTPRFNDFLRSLNLSLIAIDEAHCISEWGHDFRPDYRNLQALRKHFPKATMIALTATATERVQEDILHQLSMPHADRFVASFNRPNLSYDVRPKRRSFDVLVDLLQTRGGGSAIIYRFSRQGTESLASRLRCRGFKALPYHAGLEDGVRRETQERFLSDEVSIIVATIAFGMGVDKPNIRLVVHYELPKTVEGYYQETGRAGRDGLPSRCVLFFSYGDKMKQEFFIDQIEDDSERANARMKLARMVEYGASNSCRRKFLLNYFGEEWRQENCGACDTCLEYERLAKPSETFDGKEVAQKILSTVTRTGERFGASHIVGVLRGSRSKRVVELKHHELSVHGIAREIPRDELMDIVDQLVGKGLMTRAAGEFPTLYVTPLGRAFLKNRDSVTLVRSIDSPSAVGGQVNQFDAGLFEKLCVLRDRMAKENNVPAYYVFGNATLRQMASSMPGDQASLLRIRGVGKWKLGQFGDQFIAAIAGHVAGIEDKEERAPSSKQAALVSHSAFPRHTAEVHVSAPTPTEKLLSRVLNRSLVITAGNPSSHQALHDEIRKVLSTLSEREAHVLSHRIGIEDGRQRTLQEIGKGLSISGERVRQIEKKALRKLRHPSRLKSLDALIKVTALSEEGSDSSDPGTPRLETKSGSDLDRLGKSHARAYERWTPEEDRHLHGLYESGKSINEIATTLERQPSAIRSRLRRAGLIS